MDTGDTTFMPESYPQAVAAISRSEQVLPALVEELLQPELSGWASSLHQQPLDLVRLRTTLHERLEEVIRREGIPPNLAALYLGMTIESFEELLKRRIATLRAHRMPGGQPVFLKVDLDAFIDNYLPRFKTWSTRTSLLREFFGNLESATGFRPDPQYCEIEPCEHLAEVICGNSGCRTALPPRKVCVAHRERLRNREDRSLCAHCVRRVLYGDLRGAFQIAGTEARLRREYPNGRS